MWVEKSKTESGEIVGKEGRKRKKEGKSEGKKGGRENFIFSSLLYPQILGSGKAGEVEERRGW